MYTLPIKEKYYEYKKRLNELEIPMPQTDSEFIEFCNLINEVKPKVFVEIGTRHGGSLWMISQFLPDESIIVSIDLPGMGWGTTTSGPNREKVTQDLINNNKRVFLITDNSQLESTVKKLKSIIKKDTIDLLFIDGDHTWNGVSKDWELYSPLVSDGGIIAFHDIFRPVNKKHLKIQVYLLWEVLKTIFNHKQWISNEPRASGIGILYKDKKNNDFWK